MSSTEKPKILVLINDSSPALTAINYLRKREYELRVVHKLADSISELISFKPDVFLLSWNLKNTDIKKAHSFICSKFEVISFVFGEEPSTKTSLALQHCGLPNIIMPPIAGANIHTRIQAAIQRARNSQQKETHEKKRRVRDHTTLGGKEYKRPKKTEISRELVWTVRVNSTNPANQIWQTVLYNANGGAQYYYYKGTEPPDKWLQREEDEADSKTFVFTLDQEANTELLSSFQNYSELKSDYEYPQKDFDENAFKSASHEYTPTVVHQTISHPDSNVKNFEKEFSPAPKQQTLIEKSINIAIDLALSSENKSFEAPLLIDEVSNLTVSVIKSPRFKGYLVSGQADNLSNAPLMQKVFHHLNIEMQKQGEALTNLCEILELSLEPISFRQFAKERAQFLVESKFNQQELLFAYLPVDELMQRLGSEDLNPIDLSLIESDRPLQFDVFLHMPKNQKHIRYLKSGSLFTSAAFNRLTEFSVQQLYIKKSDENLFYAYCARKHIERPLHNTSISLQQKLG